MRPSGHSYDQQICWSQAWEMPRWARLARSLSSGSFCSRNLHRPLEYSFHHLLWVIIITTSHFYNENILERGGKMEFSNKGWIQIWICHTTLSEKIQVSSGCTTQQWWWKNQALIYHGEYINGEHINFQKEMFCSPFQHFRYVSFLTKYSQLMNLYYRMFAQIKNMCTKMLLQHYLW